MSTTHARAVVTPRRLQWAFPRDFPRFWFGGSPALSHLLNVYTLLVPDNEKYYIRILQRCLPRIGTTAQRKELHRFFRQESLHGMAHAKYWQNLRDDGLRIERLTGVVNAFVYRFLEPLLPLRVHAAMVAAIEYTNSYLGSIFLEKRLLRDAEPEMKRLFEWHFAEEIEHKAVAFDALHAAYPGYATRLAGALLTFPLFYLILFAGTAYLLASHGQLLRRRTVSDLYRLFIRDGVLSASLRAMGRYLKPSFHPWQIDDYGLADPILSSYAAAAQPEPAEDLVAPSDTARAA